MRKPSRSRVAGWGAVGAALLVAACGQTVDDPLDDQTYVVRGIVRYADPLPLSLDAMLVSRLHDASPANGEVLAQYELQPAGQVPIPFELRYRAADVPEETPLTVSVEIHDDGELLFVTDAPVPVGRTAAADILEIALSPTEAGQERIDALPEEEEERGVDEPPDFEPPDYDPDLMMPDPGEEAPPVEVEP